MALPVGTKAPDFTAPIEGGANLSLSAYLGKWVVLYFYPKDNTPGCTKEAKCFRDSMADITALGAEVIGVSPDKPATHDKFREKHDLNFHLVADTDKEICREYDVLGEKKMFGKVFHGVVRSTYIIDDEGIIRHVFPKVKVAGHVEEVIEKLKELQK
ncbi:MAG: thioredoxin-dependent thiol peroxidase [Candidatus Kapaibacterium sp.]